MEKLDKMLIALGMDPSLIGYEYCKIAITKIIDDGYTAIDKISKERGERE